MAKFKDIQDLTNRGEKSLLGTAGRAALGLTAAAAAAYGMYLWGAPTGRRRPVTELPNALDLRVHYVRWRQLHYAYYSRAGSGRPIVFLHSINAAASAHELKPLVDRMRAQTDRPIYALEWLGFGYSDRPEISYTPDVLEDQLEHFLTHIVRYPSGADIIGLSLGGNYAARLLGRKPDLARSLVALEPSELGGEPSEIGRAWARVLFTLPGVQRAFYDRLTTPDALEDFARENLFTDEFGVPPEFVKYGFETARAEGAARPLDDFLNGRFFPDDDEAFTRIDHPILVIHGTVEDRRMENYTDIDELIERPNVSVVPLRTGAMPHWERPGETMDRITAFYRGLEDPSTEPTPSAS